MSPPVMGNSRGRKGLQGKMNIRLKKKKLLIERLKIWSTHLKYQFSPQ